VRLGEVTELLWICRRVVKLSGPALMVLLPVKCWNFGLECSNCWISLTQDITEVVQLL